MHYSYLHSCWMPCPSPPWFNFIPEAHRLRKRKLATLLGYWVNVYGKFLSHREKTRPSIDPRKLVSLWMPFEGSQTHKVWLQYGRKEMFCFATSISYILQNRIRKMFHRLDSRVFVWCRFYQIRTALRVSPKLPVKVEVNLPRNQREYALMTFIKPSKIIAF